MTVSSHLVKLRKMAAYRAECQRVIIATEKIIREIAPDVTIHTLLLPKGAKCHLEAERMIEVKPSLLERVSGLKKTNDWVAEVSMPPPSDLTHCKRLLVLDGLTDPGNVGTLLRSALAFGWDGVLFVGDGVDPFNEKVIRASRGALFRLPYRQDGFNLDAFDVWVADTQGEAVESLTPPDQLALVLGSEAHGPSLRFQHHRTITIPISGKMESLNVTVAGSILLHTLGRSPWPHS